MKSNEVKKQSISSETASNPSPHKLMASNRVKFSKVFAVVLAMTGCTPVTLATTIKTDSKPEHAATEANQNNEELPVEKSNDLLPEYPVSNKIAIIINGDAVEERHKYNVKIAIETLKNKGFNEFFVASDQYLNTNDLNLSQFSGTKKGIQQLFEGLVQSKTLQKDSLVFFYTTGHGNTENGKGCLVLADDCYEQDEMVSNLEIIKDRGARGIFVMDQCYSGTMPEAIIKSGIEGVAMSPGVSGKETACQFFSPAFFKNLEENYDHNGDNISEPSEWFQGAMIGYRIYTGNAENGEYTQSKPELSLSNIESILQSKKVVIIDINATWCIPCKDYSNTLDQVNGLVGGQVKIVNLTVDENQETERLFEKLGVAEPASYPTTLIRQPNGQFKTVIGNLSLAEVVEELDKVGVKYETVKYEQERRRAEGWADDWPIELLEATEQSPEIVLENIDHWINEPWGAFIAFEVATLAPLSTLKLFNKYGGKWWTLDLMKVLVAADSESVLKYLDLYRDQPWAEEILENANYLTNYKLGIESGISRGYVDFYARQPWAKEIFELAKKVTSGKPHDEITDKAFIMLGVLENFLTLGISQTEETGPEHGYVKRSEWNLWLSMSHETLEQVFTKTKAGGDLMDIANKRKFPE